MIGAYLTFNGMKLITSTQARTLWKIQGKPIDRRTFDKIVKYFGIKPEYTSPQGSRFFDEEKIKEIAPKLPRKRSQFRPETGGLIRYFQDRD